jgi:hypothetical protein
MQQRSTNLGHGKALPIHEGGAVIYPFPTQYTIIERSAQAFRHECEIFVKDITDKVMENFGSVGEGACREHNYDTRYILSRIAYQLALSVRDITPQMGKGSEAASAAAMNAADEYADLADAIWKEGNAPQEHEQSSLFDFFYNMFRGGA